MHSHIGLLATLIFTLFATASCNDESGDSSKVTVGIIPDKPIVIDADLTLPVNTVDGIFLRTIEGPYFRFVFAIENESDKPLVITTLVLRVFDDQGNTSTVSFDGGEVGETELMIVPAGQTAFWGDGVRFVNATSTTTEPATEPVLYVGNLPTSQNNTFRYRVRVEPKGWFGTPTEPTDRFKRDFNIFTQ